MLMGEPMPPIRCRGALQKPKTADDLRPDRERTALGVQQLCESGIDLFQDHRGRRHFDGLDRGHIHLMSLFMLRSDVRHPGFRRQRRPVLLPIGLEIFSTRQVGAVLAFTFRPRLDHSSDFRADRGARRDELFGSVLLGSDRVLIAQGGVTSTFQFGESPVGWRQGRGLLGGFGFGLCDDGEGGNLTV
jgi:hypothetical protein